LWGVGQARGRHAIKRRPNCGLFDHCIGKPDANFGAYRNGKCYEKRAPGGKFQKGTGTASPKNTGPKNLTGFGEKHNVSKVPLAKKGQKWSDRSAPKHRREKDQGDL